MKCESEDPEETDSVSVYEQVIANLSKQLEDVSLSLDAAKQSETNLKLSLRLSQQRAIEAETKLVYAADRYVHSGDVWWEGQWEEDGERDSGGRMVGGTVGGGWWEEDGTVGGGWESVVGGGINGRVRC